MLDPSFEMIHVYRGSKGRCRKRSAQADIIDEASNCTQG